MTGPFTPWGTMPFKAADLATIDELNSVRTSSRASDGALDAARAGASEPPPSLAPGMFPQGRAPHGATAPAGAGDKPAPAFSSHAVPASFSLSHPSRLLLRRIALHERISEGEALARAVAFYAADHLKLRDLSRHCEDHRAERAVGHRNNPENS